MKKTILLLIACSFIFTSCSTSQKSGVFSPSTAMSNNSASKTTAKTAVSAMSMMTQMLSTGSSLAAPKYAPSRAGTNQNKQPTSKDSDGYYVLPSWDDGQGTTFNCRIKPTPDFFANPSNYTSITIEALLTYDSSDESGDMTFLTKETLDNGIVLSVDESGTAKILDKKSGMPYSLVFSGTYSSAAMTQNINIDTGNGYTASISLSATAIDLSDLSVDPVITGSGEVEYKGATVAKIVIAKGNSYYTLADENYLIQHPISDAEIELI